MYLLNQPRCFRNSWANLFAAPDLPAKSRVLVDQNNISVALRCSARGRHPRRPSAHNQYVARMFRHHCVRTSIPSRHTIAHERQCGTPSIVTRHSKQIPIPHNGPRASPLTDRRNAATPAIATAAETMLPNFTRTGLLFTVTDI